MKVAVAQLACRQNQPLENFRRAADWMSRAASNRADLILFPELFNTGCTADAISSGGIEKNGAELAELCDLSAKLKIAVIIGLAEQAQSAEHSAATDPAANTDVFNSCFFITPDSGVIQSYRKTHLCPYPPFFENLILKPGSEAAAIDYLGFKIGLTICFDLRFPEFYRNLAASGCNLIINCASWPRVRVQHWETLLAARAIENQAFIVAANQVGSHKDLVFAGKSKIIDPLGEVLVEGGSDSEELLSAELDPKRCAEVRKAAPVLDLRRIELYGS